MSSLSAPKSRILLYGLGAIGGFYAFILSRDENVSLTVVARSNFDAVKQNGLRIQSDIHGDHVVRFDEVVKTPADAGGYFDFIVITAKAIDVDITVEKLRPVTKAETTIVIVQNGVGNEDAFREAFAGSTIISCVTWVGAQQPTPGIVKHIKSEHTELGLFPNPSLPASLEQSRLDLFCRHLTTGGTVFSVYADIQVKRWEKLVWNVAWNPLTTLTMLDTQAWLNSSPHAIEMTRALMREVIDVGKACGVKLDDGLVDRLIERILGLPPITSSMQTDAREGRPLELEVIVGTPFRRGKEVKVRTPVLDTIYALVLGVDCRLRGGKS